ncbi:hypothetical protein [Streptomyces sp. S1]|uniref:hypothetical protein n=1 Tax=Streptomyces sp. S1 TaxID=718288 RepID=UPI003D730ACE
MDQIPDAIDVLSLRTHRLILAVTTDGQASVESNLSREDVAAILRTLAHRLAPQTGSTITTCVRELFTGEPCSVHGAPAPAQARRERPGTVTPKDALGELQDAVRHVLQLFLDRVPRTELDADTMADAVTDALSDELNSLYAKVARLEPAIIEQERQTTRAQAAVARVRAWCDDLDASVRHQHGDPHAEHPHAVALRLILDPQDRP